MKTKAGKFISFLIEGKEPLKNSITVLDKPMMYRLENGDLVYIIKTGMIDGVGVGLTTPSFKGKPYNSEWIDISDAHLVI